jgi:surfactin synthase thioesterase subunit
VLEERDGALRRFVPRPDAALRLFCFPHGGGGASAYADWAAALPPTIEPVAMQYPGREDRMGEPVPADMDELADGLAAAIAPLTGGAYALFGHSMGATVAYEVAQRLRAGGARPPAHLVASAREAPHDEQGGDVHRGDDEDLYAELLRLGATPPEVLRDPELRKMIFSYVRADYRIIETYRARRLAPLDCPVTVFLGDRDPDLTAAEAMGWRRATRARTELRLFSGDHFYLVPRRAAVLAALRQILAGHGAG